MMRAPSSLHVVLLALSVIGTAACGVGQPPPPLNATNYDTGEEAPDKPPAAAKPIDIDTGGSGSPYADGSLAPGETRLKPSLCEGETVRPEYSPLNETSLVSFLAAHGYPSTVVRARGDLVYVDVTDGSHPVRLRVAILPDPPAAGRDLHEAILEHGPGSWGVHRSNLAVLAPIGSGSEVIAFAGKTKLACWGVLTMAGRDDTFVIPGGYTEL
jgi:hypothetical protein